MKKFTKLFLSCAAVAAITAALATSAMAADDLKGDIVGQYDNGTLTLTAPAGAAATKTLLVLNAGADKTDIKAVDILGIDQAAEITTVKLDASKIDTAENSYTVLMGGGDTIYVATFGKGGVLLGDVTLDGIGTEGIDLDDASAIVQHYLEIKVLTGDALIAADVDDAKGVDLDDASAIVQYYLELSGSYHVGETR